MIYLNNNTEVQEIFIPKQEITAPANPKPTYENGFEEGKKVGYNEGREYQKDQLLNLYVTENGEYEREDGWGVVTVDVPTEGSDCSEAYDKGFEDGYNQGQAECPEGGDCNLGEGEIFLTTNDVGTYEMYASDEGYDGWSKFIVTLEGGGAIYVHKASVLLDFFNNGGNIDYGAYYYVGGEITEIQEVSTQYGNATYTLDNGFKVYRGKWIDGNGFDSEDQIKVGAYIVVYGVIGNYNGTLQFNAGSQVIAYQECEGGEGNCDDAYNQGYQDGYNQGQNDCPSEGGCNLEDKWVTPSMDERDGNGLIVINPSAGYDGMSRTVIDPQTIYNEGVEAGKTEGGEGGDCNLGILDLTLTDPYTVVKDASEDGYDGYNQVIVRPDNIIAQERENAINEFKNQMQEITITENGTYSIDDTELVKSIAFDGNSYFDTGIVPTENIKIEVCVKVTDGNDSGMGGIIIGGGIDPVDYQNYYGTENRGIAIGMGGGAIYGVWGATRSYNNPYEYEKTTTVVLQKTDDSWGWEGEKGSFGASTLYIGGYNMNGEEVEEKFTQSIVYIKIWTNRNDDTTLITYVPYVTGNFDANGVELQRLGDGITTYVEENVNIYPYGFKRVEVNVPSYETAIRNFYWCPVIVEDTGFGERAKSFTLATDAIMLDTDRNNLNPQTQMLYIPRSDNQNTIMTTKEVTAIGNFPFEGSDAPYVGKIKIEGGVTTFGCENVDMSGLYALELGESINSIVLRNCNTRNLNKIIVHSNLNCDIYFTYTAAEGVVYINENNPFRATWENALGSGWTIEYL